MKNEILSEIKELCKQLVMKIDVLLEEPNNYKTQSNYSNSIESQIEQMRKDILSKIQMPDMPQMPNMPDMPQMSNLPHMSDIPHMSNMPQMMGKNNNIFTPQTKSHFDSIFNPEIYQDDKEQKNE